MIRRSASLVLLLALVAGACAYESSGTTTTTTIDPLEQPPATGPADIVIEDQRIEGTVVMVESVTLPADGWVVLREDVSGTPGELIGISEILRQGVIANVPIPLFVPITEDTVVHASIHVDMDRDGIFTYEPPDSLVDEIATFANGSVATATALIELLPPLEPAEAIIEDTRSDGTVVEGASAVLPSPGFVALHADADGAPGDVITTTGLLPAGAHDELEFTPTPALREPLTVWVVVWIDRDEDGALDVEEDSQGVRPDGTIAQDSATVQVVPIEPSSIAVSDQEGDGTTITIEELVLPSAGFVEILADEGGEPGERLDISAARVAGTYEDVVIELDDALEEETTLWVRVLIDFDEDGEPTDADRIGLVEPDGAAAQEIFTYTIEEDT